MAELERLRDLDKLLCSLRKDAIDIFYVRRQILALLNTHFGDYGGFSLKEDIPVAEFCKKIEGTHLQEHSSLKVTKIKKKFDFGSADAPNLTKDTKNSELSETSSKLLSRSKHHKIKPIDPCAVAIKAHHAAQLIDALGFKGYHFEVNRHVFENPSFPGQHSTLDAYLKNGSSFIPVEIVDIHAAARKKRREHEKTEAAASAVGDQEQNKSNAEASTGTPSLQPFAYIGKRDSRSESKEPKRVPAYCEPSSRVPVPHKHNPGVLRNLTSVAGPEETDAFVQKQRILAVDEAHHCASAFRTQLSRKTSQCDQQMAIMGAKNGVVLLWDTQHCTMYYRILERDSRFEQRITNIKANCENVRDLTFGLSAHPNQNNPADFSNEVKPEFHRDLFVARPPSNKPKGPELLKKYKDAASRAHVLAMMGEEAEAALGSDSDQNASASESLSKCSDEMWTM